MATDPPAYDEVMKVLTNDLERVKSEIPMDRWNEDMVSTFLSETCNLSQYVESFKENGIDGLVLAELSDGDLVDLNVGNKFHRRKILLQRDKIFEAAADRESQAAAEADEALTAAEAAEQANAAEQRRATQRANQQKMLASHAANGGQWMQGRRSRMPCGRCSACSSGWRDQCANPWSTTPARWNCCHQQNQLCWCK